MGKQRSPKTSTQHNGTLHGSLDTNQPSEVLCNQAEISYQSNTLQIKTRTLSKEEPSALRVGPLVRLLVKRLGQDSWAAEHLWTRQHTKEWETGKSAYHANVSLGVLLDDGVKHTVPVGPAEVGGSAQGGDGVFLGTDVLDLSHRTHRFGDRSENEGRKKGRTMMLFMSSSLILAVR